MREVVVEASFDFGERGVAVAFIGSAADLPAGVALPVRIRRPDGTSCTASATVELPRRTSPQLVERSALLVMGVAKAEVPSGSVITIDVEDGTRTQG